MDQYYRVVRTPGLRAQLALSDLWCMCARGGSFARRVIQGPRALKLRVSPCRGAVADARDMSAADFATPQDRRTRRCAWGGESEGWKGGEGEGVQGTRGRCRDTGSIRRIRKNSLKSIDPSRRGQPCGTYPSAAARCTACPSARQVGRGRRIRQNPVEVGGWWKSVG